MRMVRWLVGRVATAVRRYEDALDEPHGGYRRVPEAGAPWWLRRLRERLMRFANGPGF